MKLMNLRPEPVDGIDPFTGEPFHCAARPGTMEVPDKLGRNLAHQEENWQVVEDEKKKTADTKKES